MALFRVLTTEGPRFAVGEVAGGPRRLLAADFTLAGLLSEAGGVAGLERWATEDAAPPDAPLAAPIDVQEIWSSGVTYPRSRDARMSESALAQCYEHIYTADRPELFFKCLGADARGPEAAVGIRGDSTWDVPEPELGVVANRIGAVVAFVIGNDVTSRSIEAENPLYLSQAKVYDGSCAIGPCLVGVDEAPAMAEMTLELRVQRGGAEILNLGAEVSTMRRDPAELVDWLMRARRFDSGVVLLTGTPIVPQDAFSLEAEDEISITIEGLGTLRNTVRRVAPRGAVRQVEAVPPTP